MWRHLFLFIPRAALCLAALALSCGDRITNTTTNTTVVSGSVYRVFGRVLDGAGEGVEDVGVVITGVGVDDTTTTGKYGFYAFDGIPSGLYVVTADTASLSANAYADGDSAQAVTVLGADEQVDDYTIRGPYVTGLLRVSFLDDDDVLIPRTEPAYHYVYVYLATRVEAASVDTAGYRYSYTIPLDYASLLTINVYLGAGTASVASADVEVYAVSGTRILKERVDLASGSGALTVDTPSLMHDIRTK